MEIEISMHFRNLLHIVVPL